MAINRSAQVWVMEAMTMAIQSTMQLIHLAGEVVHAHEGCVELDHDLGSFPRIWRQSYV